MTEPKSETLYSKVLDEKGVLLIQRLMLASLLGKETRINVQVREGSRASHMTVRVVRVVAFRDMDTSPATAVLNCIVLLPDDQTFRTADLHVHLDDYGPAYFDIEVGLPGYRPSTLHEDIQPD